MHVFQDAASPINRSDLPVKKRKRPFGKKHFEGKTRRKAHLAWWFYFPDICFSFKLLLFWHCFLHNGFQNQTHVPLYLQISISCHILA